MIPELYNKKKKKKNKKVSNNNDKSTIMNNYPIYSVSEKWADILAYINHI